MLLLPAACCLLLRDEHVVVVSGLEKRMQASSLGVWGEPSIIPCQIVSFLCLSPILPNKKEIPSLLTYSYLMGVVFMYACVYACVCVCLVCVCVTAVFLGKHTRFLVIGLILPFLGDFRFLVCVLQKLTFFCLFASF